MEPQDYGKLAYQSEFGPEHLVTDDDRTLKSILAERGCVPTDAPNSPEGIGNGLCRFPICQHLTNEEGELLARLLVLTAQNTHGTRTGLEEKLRFLQALSIPGMEKWCNTWRLDGYPPVHHSERYRAAYQPHYRLLRTEYAGFFSLLTKLRRITRQNAPAVVAIDGRCGSGKTGLATLIASLFPCNIVHMDDYYLPLEQRTTDWETTPGGNMDFPRFLAEVLTPAWEGKPIFYRPYHCQTGKYGPTEALPLRHLTVIEGSYSQHPLLSERYNLKIFLTCTHEEQILRLQEREGDYFSAFQARWIPLEEQYYTQYSIAENADFTVDTSGFFD